MCLCSIITLPILYKFVIFSKAVPIYFNTQVYVLCNGSKLFCFHDAWISWASDVCFLFLCTPHILIFLLFLQASGQACHSVCPSQNIHQLLDVQVFSSLENFQSDLWLLQGERKESRVSLSLLWNEDQDVPGHLIHMHSTGNTL